ncbi:MAG: GAF domain-containing protein, partial [Planktothrix sp.]
MKSASPTNNSISGESTVVSSQVIDVTPVEESTVNQNGNQIVNPVGGDTPSRKPATSTNGGLVPTVAGGGSFSSFLAPLTKDNFVEVVKNVEDKLKTVNQTLSMLNNLLDAQGFEEILNEMLRSITIKIGELLNADRTTIWLVDEEKHELWSIVAGGQDGKPLELRIPSTAGIAGEVATTRTVVNIPYDFYNDPRSAAAKKMDQRNGYRTYTMVVMPLLNDEDGLVAVVQLLNKLKLNSNPLDPLDEKIDLEGFTADDEKIFEEFVPSIRLILESSRSFYAATVRQRAAAALMNAVNA